MRLVLPITDADFAYGARTFWRSFDAYLLGDQGVLLRRLASPSSRATWGSTPSRARRASGRSTTGAVVSSSVMILLLDVVLTKLLLNQ